MTNISGNNRRNDAKMSYIGQCSSWQEVTYLEDGNHKLVGRSMAKILLWAMRTKLQRLI